jgi:haloalkane dehalogenase
MAYVEIGAGDPIVFLHGNPTSSFLWRNVTPHVQAFGRCIAPDLMGMGDSDKLPDSGPNSYLDGLLQSLGIEQRVTLVVHDWGSALGFDWANRHREAVRGIAYMEAIVRVPRWDEWREQTRPIFQRLRSPEGEQMILEENLFVERILPRSIRRQLTDEEMAEYRRPFAEPGEGRRPTLTWPREIPFDGDPPDVAEIVRAYAEWLPSSDVPKLFINAEPGAILVGPMREFCRTWRNQQEVTVPGIHFIQEDSPDVIGQLLAEWLEGM